MPDDDAITFPDAPRGELDRALQDLVERAREVMKTQGRLRALVRANQAVVSHLDLPTVLRTIIDAAVELVGARYGALGVIAQQGGLEQFIHVGMSPREVDQIGHLPEGHGLLGALIDDPRPIRLDDIAADSRSAGFPVGHPAMDSFLGVPIRVRDSVYGNLYLTNHIDGSFTHEDEQLVKALAGTAGFAIDNARLFAETEARQAWSAASAEVTSALLSGDAGDALVELVEHVERLTTSDLVCVLTAEPSAERVTVILARGRHGVGLDGAERPLDSVLLRGALESAQPQRVDALDGDAFSDADWRPGGAIIVPLPAAGAATSVLLAMRTRGAPGYSTFELERVADIAGQAGLAMELAAARADRQRMLLLEDRTRIARDLHDHVIQQLFAAGLDLQSIQAEAGRGRVADRIETTVGTLDAAITQIRTIIFALSHRADTDNANSLRHQLIDLADQLSPGLAQPATLAFSGPLDLVVDGEIADDVVAFVREALTNVARHAHAETAAVMVDATAGEVMVVIEDDGVGIGDATRRSGLRNGAERAERHGGTLEIDSDSHGTRLTWSVPLRRKE
ncbi:GAF domain-containing sensor histidine kinase [Leifsonia poae]|uniref:Histidine kinase n=1 Tax=Leifsonia poae TaxID=110933 RepID=A0A9W6M056_9MICO|nr:GAF domain-containing protein [Leifsonia poae]GLJ76531.1 histidine kinase [Leifsonia poae]